MLQTASCKMKPNDKPCRLGRRPVKQGPRPLLSDQDRVGKSATGRNMNIEDGTMQLRKKMRIGTWNIRSMLQLGKVQNLGRELERLRVEIGGITEVRWSGRGHFYTSEGHMIIYSGEESQGHSGVGVWIHERRKTVVIGYETVSSRILVVRLKAKPRCIALVQVYAPTADGEDGEIEEFYQEMTNTLKKISRRHYSNNGGFQRQSRKCEHTTSDWRRRPGKDKREGRKINILLHGTGDLSDQYMVQTTPEETIHMDIAGRKHEEPNRLYGHRQKVENLHQQL